MKVTSEVNNILVKAYEEAKERNSEYITPEHLLYAATFDDTIMNAIEELGGDIGGLRYNLATYIKTYISRKTGEPQESIDFQKVILRANEQVRYSQRDAIDVEHIMAAFFDLEESYALYYLQQEGIIKGELLYKLCHRSDTDEFISEDKEDNSDDNNRDELELSEEAKTKKREDAFLHKFTIDLTEKAK